MFNYLITLLRIYSILEPQFDILRRYIWYDYLHYEAEKGRNWAYKWNLICHWYVNIVAHI